MIGMERIEIHLTRDDVILFPQKWIILRSVIEEKFRPHLSFLHSIKELRVFCPRCDKEMEGGMDEEKRIIRYKCSGRLCSVVVEGKILP